MSRQTLYSCSQHPLSRHLALVGTFVAYLTVGAAIFQLLERPNETDMVSQLRSARHNFSLLGKGCISGEGLA
ncbi:hypothetical protein ACOMHN_026541 [Nucella lapillus]